LLCVPECNVCIRLSSDLARSTAPLYQKVDKSMTTSLVLIVDLSSHLLCIPECHLCVRLSSVLARSTAALYQKVAPSMSSSLDDPSLGLSHRRPKKGKSCPACRAVVGNRSLRCECGHVFMTASRGCASQSRWQRANNGIRYYSTEGVRAVVDDACVPEWSPIKNHAMADSAKEAE
jgi:hypothetical protein